jgi:hypothetical protein
MPSRYEQLLDAHSVDTPQQWRPFATRIPRTFIDGGYAWGEFAYSFKKVADIVAKEFYNRNEINPSLFPALLFLYRHWIELSLKEIWKGYFDNGLLDREPPASHNILWLWRRVKQASVSIHFLNTEDAFLSGVEKTIQEFNKIDNLSQYKSRW